MNARTQVFELSVEGRQVEEVALSLFHTLLFHRTLGKFHYKQEGSYSVGTIGYEDVDCDFVDLTYISIVDEYFVINAHRGSQQPTKKKIFAYRVRCASSNLDHCLRREVSSFSDLLLSTDNSHNGQISLEFYQKKRTRWPFPSESIPWEIWTLKVNLISLNNEHERQKYREKIGEVLAEKILYVAEAMNRHEYVPKMPNQSELELIFDNTYTDVQPYLFKISYQTSGPANSSVGTTVRKLIKDTLAL